VGIQERESTDGEDGCGTPQKVVHVDNIGLQQSAENVAYLSWFEVTMISQHPSARYNTS
jgi:hypothetical protein